MGLEESAARDNYGLREGVGLKEPAARDNVWGT